jgi:hypothetical protein
MPTKGNKKLKNCRFIGNSRRNIKRNKDSKSQSGEKKNNNRKKWRKKNIINNWRTLGSRHFKIVNKLHKGLPRG